MKQVAFRIIVLAVVPFFTGCATVVMRTDISGSQPKGLYPATRADVGGAYRYCVNKWDPFGGWRGAGPRSHPDPLEKLLWVAFSVLDLPISLVTDTVYLPSDLWKKRAIRSMRNDAQTTD